MSCVLNPFLSDTDGGIDTLLIQEERNSIGSLSILHSLPSNSVMTLSDNLRSRYGRRQMPVYPQDRLTVRNAGSFSVLSVNYPSGSDWYSAFYRNNVPESDSIKWAANDEYFPIEGGNMHVCGYLVFIGKDDSAKHQSESDILQHVLGSPNAGKVIWIGSSHSGSDDHRSNSSYQPAYHTDMFFCPMSFDGQTLRFVFALPDNACLFSGNRVVDSLGALEKRFGDTLDNLTRDLRAIGITPDPIRIQLPVYYGNTRLEQYWCHANGLVENVDGITRYWMPCYSERSAMSENDWPRLLEIQDSNRSVLQDQGIEVVDIPGFEIDGDRTASLRCKVKVLHRSY